jgi:hypothetical protein
MCDYSLEAYRTRPARQGEHYTTHRFPSGTIGFIAPGDTVTAICLAYDTKLTLDDIRSRSNRHWACVRASPSRSLGSRPVCFTTACALRTGPRSACSAWVSV